MRPASVRRVPQPKRRSPTAWAEWIIGFPGHFNGKRDGRNSLSARLASNWQLIPGSGIIIYAGKAPQHVTNRLRRSGASQCDMGRHRGVVHRGRCDERGKEPQRPYSGNFTVRITPELHRRIATAAARNGKSVNAFVAETLERSA